MVFNRLTQTILLYEGTKTRWEQLLTPADH